MRIHLIGIGGVAMGNLAAMFLKLGHEVTGSDVKLYPPMSLKLSEWGIKVNEFDEKNILDKDLCVIGNVISRGNVEVEALLNNKSSNYLSMPQALRQFFLSDKEVIVIAGTHGKTTTSFLMDHVLQVADFDNGFFAGGVRGDGMEGFRLSANTSATTTTSTSTNNGKYFVIEGDEYDTAFFDKAPKFLHYKPYYLIMQAIEFDHADIYKDLESYEKGFKNLLKLIPQKGVVIANKRSKGISNILSDYKYSSLILYDDQNLEKKNNIKNKLIFKINGKDYDLNFIMNLSNFALLGKHNRMNALSVTLLALHLGIKLEKIKIALESFKGVLRRQQLRLELPKKDNFDTLHFIPNKNNFDTLYFIEDFAHHPGALSACISSMREIYPSHKLHILFEPRSASSHLKIFEDEYLKYFKLADQVYITEVYNKKKVNAKKRLNVKSIVKNLNIKKEKAFYNKDPESLFNTFSKNFKRSKEGDVIIGLSNGNFGGIYSKIENFLKKLN